MTFLHHTPGRAVIPFLKLALSLFLFFILMARPGFAQGVDSDNDGISDADEIACGSDPDDFTSRCAGLCELPNVDVWDSTDENEFLLIGQIGAIQTAQTGAQHYDYFNASGHPTCVNLADRLTANTWMHQDTNTSDLTFGFEFAREGGTPPVNNTAQLNFRIVNSATDPYVSQSDDPGEAVETPAGSNAFLGNYRYVSCCSDGIAVSGISGDWTIIIDAVNFGNITDWYMAGGQDCNGMYADDIDLTLGNEYRLTPACDIPSDLPVVIEDEDDDGIIDEEDNCPTIPNPGQEDDDMDGVGDVCDQCPGEDDTIDENNNGLPDCTENQPPEAVCAVLQLTEIGDDAQVSFSGEGSSDPDDDALTYSWSIDGIFASSEQSFSQTLGYGDHTVVLTVTDEAGATDTCETEVTIDPANLAVFECDKIEVKFCQGDADSNSSDSDSSADDGSSACLSDRVKIYGQIGLPMGVDYTDLTMAQALALVDAANVDFTDGSINTFEVKGGSGEHWKYRADGPGLTKLDIDWKGARFKYDESGFPVELESELITTTSTVLTMKYDMDDAGGPFTVDFDGTLLDVDAAGTVTAPNGGVDDISVKKTGKKVELTLPFPLIEGSVVTFGGALSGSVNVSDHYTHSLGRFKLEAESGSTLAAGADSVPREVNMIIGVGGPLYTNTCSAGADDFKVYSRKWKAKK